MQLQDYGIEVGNRTGGIAKVQCPVCTPERKNKRDKSLSVNISEGVWLCHNCGWKGGLSKKKEEKTWYYPQDSKLEPSEKAISWFLKRGIELETLVRFKIGESMEVMPQVKQPRNCINFKYYQDGTLVNIKYRDGEKNFKMVKDAKLIFYNIDGIKDSDQAIIVEGEIDCLSVYQCGFKHVVSVPNGASKGNQNLEYLDACIASFKGKTRIVIATDDDEAGMMLRNELSRRLGKHRCLMVDYPEGCKDFNEVLVAHGSEKVAEVVKSARPFPLEGIITVRDVSDRLMDIYRNGFPRCDEVGFVEFDKLLKFRRGELTVVTGIPNSGKSLFLDQICSRLASRHNWKFCVYSFENQPVELHMTKIAAQFIGMPFYRSHEWAKMSRAEYDYALQFIENHFVFVNLSEIECTIDGILEKSIEILSAQGIDGVIIDPYNYLEHKRPPGVNETEYISEFLSKVKRFCISYDVHVFIVAHPVKMQKDKDKKYMIPTLYDISGSSHWFNKSDNGVVVYRDDQTNAIDVYVQKVRFFFVGKKGMAAFKHDISTHRYADLHLNFEKDYEQYFKLGREKTSEQQRLVEFTEPEQTDYTPF